MNNSQNSSLNDVSFNLNCISKLLELVNSIVTDQDQKTDLIQFLSEQFTDNSLQLESMITNE